MVKNFIFVRTTVELVEVKAHTEEEAQKKAEDGGATHLSDVSIDYEIYDPV
jgi:hypothetical protein